MNVYDFDKTIYPVDSTVAFWKHCLRRYPLSFLALPGALCAGLAWKAGLGTLEGFKGRFYRFLRFVPAGEAARFWDAGFSKVEPWYLAQREDADVIISASPEFLIGEVCRRLGVAYLASPVEEGTGRLLGKNCRDAEKVRRFRAVYGDAGIGKFYSDSLSDTPLAALAQEAFLVDRGALKPWPREAIQAWKERAQ